MSSNIDKIIYINLEKRTDRKEQIESQLNAFELPYERFNAVSHALGMVGCSYSHLNVLKLAKERNYKNVLILEDDFMFLISKEEFENQLNQFFNNVKEYDVCMISYGIEKDEVVPEHNFIKRTIESHSASGYIVNNHYYNKLIELYEWAIPMLEKTKMHWVYMNDQIWKQLQRKDKWYYFTLRFGKQRPGFSDLGNCFVEYDC